MGVFFIDTDMGRVATERQLLDAGVTPEGEAPPRPWHRVSGPSDASTMWYSVMRKRTRGVFIGTLCLRHTERKASLEQQGWEEVPIAEISVSDAEPRSESLPGSETDPA